MRPAIISVHYHLRPGGVTRVIESTDRILREVGETHLVLTGEDVPELDYDALRSGDLADRLRTVAVKRLGSRPRLWHFHNPCLGKNPALTRSLVRLAETGEAMILQHHDLAEDERSGNLEVLGKVAHPYPTSPRIAHAFLNRRDRDLFTAAGLPRENTVLLPNPATPPAESRPSPTGAARLLLPMRGIPRKNLGEMLLLATAAPAGTRFFQGSAPGRQEWLPAYQAWCRFSEDQGLPVDFDVFRAGDPDAWIDRSTHLLTTSTREGFGMIHLEAAGRRRVLGRRIAHLDLDGFPTDGLYDALLLDGRDFATLDDESQRREIQAFARGEAEVRVVKAGRLTPLRPWFARQLEDRAPRDASAALGRHSAEAHRSRLLELRDRLLAAPKGPIRQVDRHLIAAAFA